LGVASPKQDKARLSDRISIGVLTQTFPPDLIDRTVVEAGRKEKRNRLLPARVVVYFCLFMCLFSRESYNEVMALMVKGLRWTKQWSPSWQLPTDGAIALARQRLGPEPLHLLFEAVAQPLAHSTTKGAWYRKWRLMAIDGTILDLADTKENESFYGRPANSRGDNKSAFPQARVVGLVECGTHAITDASVGGCNQSENELVTNLFESLRPGMLVLCDRGFWSFDLWKQARETGADLLWRTKSNIILPVVEMLPDGSYLSRIFSSDDKKKQNPTTVRVIEYQLDGLSGETYRLVTTILDHTSAPAEELAALYAERWEIESVFDEAKTRQRGAGAVLRSKHPETVEQEIWSHLLVHYAIRALMADAAEEADVDPDRTSFLGALRIVRRQVTDPTAFSPR
jgi:hypothetical protein